MAGTTVGNTGDAMENRIRVYRAIKGITQEQLAKVIGITRQTVIAIEKGNYNPSLELAFKLAKYFETTIEEVFIYV